MRTVFSSFDNQSVAPAVESKIRRVVRAIGQQEKNKGTVTIVWAANETVRRLNKKFRKIDRTTDVLSFPVRRGSLVDSTPSRRGNRLLDPPRSDAHLTGSTRSLRPPHIGDVIIAVPQAIRQAPRFANEPPQELLRLAVHGVYHLLGYDHHRPAEAAVMKKREAWAIRQ